MIPASARQPPATATDPGVLARSRTLLLRNRTAVLLKPEPARRGASPRPLACSVRAPLWLAGERDRSSAADAIRSAAGGAGSGRRPRLKVEFARERKENLLIIKWIREFSNLFFDLPPQLSSGT